ncbi:MAG: prepilin-type N-terminal cleavage/methylation domain-containing protein [Candidatus Saccharimonas sp.]
MRRYQKGDTLIELVIAFAIFSLAAVTTLVILNKGIATTQRTLEATLVRQQVDSQAELIRYIHYTQDPLWDVLVDPANIAAAPAPISSNSDTCPAVGSSAVGQGFYIRPAVAADPANTTFTRLPINGTTYRQAQTYSKIDYTTAASPSEGIWIQVAEAQNDTSTTVRAYDFYIHACWSSVGLDRPMTLGTIVRLYDNE